MTQPTSTLLVPCRSLRTRLLPVSLAVGLILNSECLVAANVENAVISGPTSQFAISPMPVGDSLIELAQQANLTIIFPFEQLNTTQANPVFGELTVADALASLLEDTGFQASFSQKGVVTITEIKDEEADNLLSSLRSIFTEPGLNMMTTPEPSPPPIEYISVRGIKASLQRSQNVKYHAFGIIDSIQAEEIGKFPDLNLAESLQRITGVSIDRSEGEGQFVTVRGFGPEFNTVLINGRKLPTDNLGREFSFDTLPSELVSGVSVAKTTTAQQITGGIGSVINIQTARPMQARGFKVSGHIKALYESNSGKSTPQGALVLGNSNQTFGWLISLSHQEREARIDEAQIDGWLPNTDVLLDELSNTAPYLFVPRNYDQRVRFDTRKRTSGSLVMQYRPNADTDIVVDYVASSFDIDTDSTSMGHWFTSSNLQDVITDENGTVVNFSQSVGHATDFHARTFNRPSAMESIGLNVEWYPSATLSLAFDVGSAKNTIDDNTGGANALTLIGYLNRSTFDHRAGTILPSISGFASAEPNIINAEGEIAGVANYLAPSNGRAHVMLRRGWEVEDTVDQIRFDGVFSPNLAHNFVDIEFGGMLITQQKQNNRWDNEKNALHCTYCGYFTHPDIPDDFQTIFNAGNRFLSGVSGHANIPKVWLRHDGNQLIDYLEDIDGTSFSPERRDSSFSVEETITSGYAQIVFESEIQDIEIQTQVGLRYEQTETLIKGFSSQLERLDILDQTELSPITSNVQPVEEYNNYRHWLPHIKSKWQLSDAVIMRFAFAKTITRPTLTQMSPSLIFNTTRQGGDLRASQGNPMLQPFEANNFDMSVEWYLDTHSYASVAYFKKSVENFILNKVDIDSFGDVVDPSTGNDPTAPDGADQLALFDITRPVNAETAKVDGIEMAFQYQFENGFGLIANATFIDSNATLNRDDLSQVFALTGLSDTQNLIGYFDSDPLQVRLAWNRRGDFLQSLSQSQSNEPTFVDDYHQIDASVSYAVNNNISVFIEGINITESSVFKHGRYDNQLLLAQSPGARYSVGLRGRF